MGHKTVPEKRPSASRLNRWNRERLEHREHEARLEEQLGVPLASKKRRVEVRFNAAADAFGRFVSINNEKS